MKKIDFSLLSKRNIHALQPYQAKEIPCRVKLDANESPYGIPEKIFSRKVFNVPLNRYPDPEAVELKRTFAGNLKVNPGNILAGNGSDELIYYLIATFGGPVLYPVPTFSMYGIISRALGENHMGIPLDRDFDIDIGRTLSAVRKHKPRLIFLSSPNNPTGNCFSLEKMLKIAETAKGVVVIDEAYQPFSSREGILPLLKDYKNLAALRTLSKIGLASLRVGFLIGDSSMIKEVNKVRLPFNLNSISQAIAAEVLKDKSVIRSAVKAVTRERGRLFRKLDMLEGVEPFPSEANFILFKVNKAPAVFLRLVKSGVLVRDLSSTVKDSLRVTVGTPEENSIFIEALKKAIRR